MNGFSRPYSDETINASPESTVDDRPGPQRSDRNVDRHDVHIQPLPLNPLKDRGLLIDLLLTLAAALLAGLAASGLFVLLV